MLRNNSLRNTEAALRLASFNSIAKFALLCCAQLFASKMPIERDARVTQQLPTTTLAFALAANVIAALRNQLRRSLFASNVCLFVCSFACSKRNTANASCTLDEASGTTENFAARWRRSALFFSRRTLIQSMRCVTTRTTSQKPQATTTNQTNNLPMPTIALPSDT